MERILLYTIGLPNHRLLTDIVSEPVSRRASESAKPHTRLCAYPSRADAGFGCGQKPRWRAIKENGYLMGIRERTKERRKRIVAHVARNHEDAEWWDLMFWQQQSPQQRLSALVAILEDVKKIKRRRS